MSDIAYRATVNRPCSVCESGTKGCSTTDGLHLCRGEPADPAAWKRVKKAGDGGFVSYRPAGDTPPASRPVPRPTTTEPARPDFPRVAREHAARMTPAHTGPSCGCRPMRWPPCPCWGRGRTPTAGRSRSP